MAGASCADGPDAPAPLAVVLPRARAAAPAGPARIAAAEELDAVVADAEPRLGGHAPAQRAGVWLGDSARDVDDAPASETGEMVVLADVAVEAAAATRQLLGQALAHPAPQVAV